MSAFIITGGKTLRGVIRNHGAKNSVLPILAATILCEGESVIHGCPNLLDVDSSLRILEHLGCKTAFESGTVTIDTANMSSAEIPDCLMREMRSSVVFLGAILARAGRATMSYPGGCELGPRPIDLHLDGLRRLGVEIHEESGNIICKAERIHGAEVNLTFPSVGATENIMLLACLADGSTRITNAAREPEIEDLQAFLNAMGARVSGAGSSTIEIEGVPKLYSAEHTIIPDRIVASTLLSCVAVSGGDITVENVIPAQLSTVISALREAGCQFTIGDNRVSVVRTKPLRAMRTIRTMPYPGFPTDAQSPVMAVSCFAGGTTVFVENIFGSRYRHVGELCRMGADIKVEGRVAVVCGVEKLSGARVSATDLRGGAAMVTAALGAEGETVVTGINHIDRGYDCFENMLCLLGADIKRIPD